MKILSVDQIRAWDAYTIEHEPIASIDLMERAASQIVNWIAVQHLDPVSFFIFCGPGNNGGDGLAIARQLHSKGHVVELFILPSASASADFTANLQRAKELSVATTEIKSNEDFPVIQENACVIDALFGTGLNRPWKAWPPNWCNTSTTSKNLY